MAHVLVVNPNTSAEMTAQIAATAKRVAHDDTEITAIRPERGPESLESFYEYHLAAVAMLEAIEPRRDEIDGVVVACYGDPGLYPLKEVLDVPVVGVAESSMATATLLGHRFAILVALDRAVPMMENLAGWYGLSDRLASVEPTGLSVLELEENEERTLDELTAAGRRAMEAGAEVVLLGCSGMSGYEDDLSDRLGVPVVNPVADAVTRVEGLIEQGLAQSHAGLWGTPPEKPKRGSMPGDNYP
jgi:allantoin racemase